MKETLTVSLIQTELHWENPEANRRHFADKIDEITEHTDLIVLPEMFTTGFSMNAKALAEPTQGTTLQWMQVLAKKRNVAITGSVIVTEGGHYYNRLFFVFPDGSHEIYDKKHTFTLAGEHKVYSAGTKRLTLQYLGWNICPLVCYDLRFPVWARNTDDYDVLLYVANWPEKRVAAWDALLKARAIENMCYCIGVNRIGNDGNGHPYVGHSAVYDVLGHSLAGAAMEGDKTSTFVLDRAHITDLREQLRFLMDRDSFQLT
ncbi:MAG: amidohydrolase [Flavobacteriaceae bacterium]|nr:amidohydrolase [Flavobacteriaceae bacterium]